MDIMTRWGKSYLLAFFIVIVGCVSISAQIQGTALPPKKIHAGERCPVSTGSYKPIPHVPYIFCSECIWFGGGTAFFVWGYRLGDGDNAVFELANVPRDKSHYSPKTPWAARSEYSGKITISGYQLDGKGTLRLAADGEKSQKSLVLTVPNHEPGDHWSFWPAEMEIPHAGCYVVEVETSYGKDLSIFKAEDNK